MKSRSLFLIGWFAVVGIFLIFAAGIGGTAGLASGMAKSTQPDRCEV
jgi:hypothetical protein